MSKKRFKALKKLSCKFRKEWLFYRDFYRK